ncbi:MAG: hypothetical protein OSB26_00385 [Woeseiaceae bacterium]|jgi:hypothetical protein|nr:hypothetical protein [Woeseiaceae bacterium]|tara:strand:- start:253 stop:780 length:528 start_codon:yes stop_codon:yes gene_type:complete
MTTPEVQTGVLRVGDVEYAAIDNLANRYGLTVKRIADGETITGSFWGEPEAGIKGLSVFVRSDTPIHSMLHEISHIICMCDERRKHLDRNAGSDDLEESAVCYLQIILADFVLGVGRFRLMQDMDNWGYSFRLGKTENWFSGDAGDAREWLVDYGLIDGADAPLFRLREAGKLRG